MTGQTLAADGLPARAVRAWHEQKLYYVSRYAEIFTVGMKNQWERLVYADFFSGPGICVVEGATESLGSPLSAARHARFNNLYFNDIDPVATDALKLRLADQPVGRVRVGNVDCNDAIDEAREFLFPRSSRPRTLGLAFIDPTAYQMRFDSLERLASDGVRVDLIINFMTDFAKRFVKTDAWREGSDFDKFMGTREWLRLKTDVPLSQLNSELLAIYRKQLAKIGYEVDDRVVVRNSGDRVLYHLVYASRSRVGLKFWHEISVTDAGQQRRLPL